jgi:hypothetical protein
MRPRHLVLAAALLGAMPASAQDAALPEPMQGLWVSGECAAPEAMLFAGHRGWAMLPTGGTQRLWRIRHTDTIGDGFTLAVGDDDQQTRLLLRVTPGGLDVREPPQKLADTELPGDAKATQFRRCPAIPAPLALLHGEGLSFLGALDGIEAACAHGDAAACIDAVWAWADVNGDTTLTAAELSRLARGVAYATMLSQGTEAEELAAALGAGALGGVAVGWALIASFDYDGSASLSKAEVMQDRFPPPGLAGAVAAAPSLPAPGVSLSGQLGALKALFEALAPLLGLPEH